MAEKVSSPKILSLAWGCLEVEDGTRYKDAKLFPGGSREWDWRETGTSHENGIQPDDLTELLDAGVDAVVISRGYHGRLEVSPEAMKLLEAREVAVHTMRTEGAVRLYNELRETMRVGGLFHTTC